MVYAVLPILASMILGRTIDLRTYTIGVDIYDPNDYDEIPLHTLNSSYTIVQANKSPYSYIGLPADLVLRIKSYHLRSASGYQGLDGLLRDTTWKSNSVSLAVTTLAQTVYRELKNNASLIPNWFNRVEKTQTHYAHSFIYGGWSVVLYRLVCSVPEDEAFVRKYLISKLGDSGSVNETTVGVMESALKELESHEDLSGDVTVQVYKYSSIPLTVDVSSIKNLPSAIKQFHADIGHLGKPMFMEMRPLHKIDSRFPEVVEDRNLEGKVEKIDELYEDLRITKENIKSWLTSSTTDFTEQEEDKIQKLYDHVNNGLQAFNSIAGSVSLYNPINENYLKTAMMVYAKGLTKGVDSYQMIFKRLKEDIDATCEDDFRRPIKGVLKVAHNEEILLGEMEGGLQQCFSECYAEKKCRAVGFAEQFPVLIKDTIIKKQNQCWIYFRSSHTATVIPSKLGGSPRLYDRACN